MNLGRTIIALPCLLISLPVWADSMDVFELRNLHPFLHVFGLPPFQHAELAEPGSSDYAFTLAIVNNSENRDTGTESIVLDGESYFADFIFRRRVHERLEIGVDVPLVMHSEGVLDRFIYDWHDFWGISNSKRGEPHNQLNYFYSDQGVAVQQLTSSSFGVGDVQLAASVPLGSVESAASRHVTMRLSVKLPTGDSGDLHGSGALDAALGVYAQDSRELLGRELAYLGFAGILALGDGDVLADRQRSAVPYGGLAATWHATGRFGVSAQLQAQGAFVDSGLDELGGSSIQLTVGGVYRWPAHGVAFRFALVEDVISDATPDFAVYVGVHVSGSRRR